MITQTIGLLLFGGSRTHVPYRHTNKGEGKIAVRLDFFPLPSSGSHGPLHCPSHSLSFLPCGGEGERGLRYPCLFFFLT